ncbi:MAG: 2Fe-2S iron-sulfur cluster-binding protein [Coraliomargaritaceae bacterium]
MAKVTFNMPSGETKTIENAVGTLMEVATENDIEGITGDCGGVCSCATCHVYVEKEWVKKIPEASELEKDTIEFIDNAEPTSRLCCQIDLTEDMDGLVVTVANEE